MKREKKTLDRRDFLVDSVKLVAGLVAGRNVYVSTQKQLVLPKKTKPYRRLEDLTKLTPAQQTPTQSTRQQNQPVEDRIYLTDYTQEDAEKMVEALFAEARGVDNRKYREDVASTFVTRALESGKSVSEVIGERGQYSYLNKGDKNAVKAGKSIEVAKQEVGGIKAYNDCVRVVTDVLKKGIRRQDTLTHYFVGDIDTPLTPEFCPEWAFDENEKPLEPDKTYKHGNNITRFYYRTPIEAKARGHVFSKRVA